MGSYESAKAKRHEKQELRFSAMDLLRGGLSKKSAAMIIGVSESTIRRWWRIYKVEGTFGLRFIKPNG